MGDKWTLLIVRDLVSGPRRFVELQRILPGISTEQLRSRLNRMVADGLLKRKRYREVPPRVEYELTDRAQGLIPVLGELARWGHDWAWGQPRRGEAVDVTAIFRLIPGLVKPTAEHVGRTELVVVDDAGDEIAYTVTCTAAAVTVAPRPAERPDARARGLVAAWVMALSPDGDSRVLEISGDGSLVERLLAAVSPAAGSRSISAAESAVA